MVFWHILATLCTIPYVLGVDWDVITELDRYVHRVDGFYHYDILAKYTYENISTDVYIVNMTSQQWMTADFSSRPVWFHIMQIAIPQNIRYPGHGFLVISGGNNRNPGIPPQEDGETFGVGFLANQAGMIGANLNQVPNQPIVFTNDPTQRERSEDAQIAWTWHSLVFMPEAQYPSSIMSRFPMTKAAKAGLDTIDNLSRQFTGVAVDKFFAVGASKRGWTTWSIAATDRRVIAAAPMVFSLLNIQQCMMKHYRSLGGYSFALKPYHAENLTTLLTDERAELIAEYEDMIRFKERFTIPMLLFAGTGDEFFQPDDSHFWLSELPGWKYISMSPNVGHTLAPLYWRIYNTILGFFLSVVQNRQLPEFTFTRTDSGTHSVVTMTINGSTTDVTAVNATAWRAETLDNSTMRDFRMRAGYPEVERQFVPFTKTDFAEISPGVFSSEVEKVDEKWVAHYVEATFPGPDGFDMTLSTELNIAPETFYYEPCEGLDCYGTLK